jgi:hypothetical protein
LIIRMQDGEKLSLEQTGCFWERARKSSLKEVYDWMRRVLRHQSYRTQGNRIGRGDHAGCQFPFVFRGFSSDSGSEF